MATVLTQNGRAFIAQKLGGVGGPAFGAQPNWVGWGVGPGAASPSANALYAERLPRAAATLSAATTSVAGDTLVIQATNTALADQAITNAGVFDSAGTGYLLVHTDLGANAIPLLSGDQIAFTFKLVF
jgi:hypothetical protein